MGIENSDLQSLWRLAPSIFDDHKVFLTDIFERFPRVFFGLKEFAHTHPWARIKLAGEKLEKKPRTGLGRFDIPEGPREILSTHGSEYYGKRWLSIEHHQPTRETILEHCAESAELAIFLFDDTPTRLLHKRTILKIIACGIHLAC